MDLSGKRVVVVGLGKSGRAAARFCARRGAQVIGTDDRDLSVDLGVPLPISLEVGGIREQTLLSASLIVLSPGVPPTLPPLQAARRAGVPITGEVELAARHIRAPLIGITGTNGKSTVTSLCGAIALATGRPSFCGGNLGTPLIEAVDTPAAGPGGIVVCEMSSFQLETAESLHCRSAAILNLTPDHLDRYPSLAAYGDAKARIARNLGPGDPLVWNADDPEVQALVERNLGPGHPAYLFSTRTKVVRGGFVDGADLVLRGVAETPETEERYPVSELQLVGRHNLANVLAAYLLMRASGLCTYEQVRAAGQTFRALPHRMEWVAERGGVRFYDDSKGTNVDAVVAGLDGFPVPFALIAGGRDKGGSYGPLQKVLSRAQVRSVVLIGEAAPLIEQALSDMQPPLSVVRAATLEEAVRRAHGSCRPGDAVILSPACSSYDMFRDYAHRAEVFRAAAERIGGPI